MSSPLLLSVLLAHLLAASPDGPPASATEPFVVTASASIRYRVDIPYERIHASVDEVGLLQRNMPGVVSIRRLDERRYMYTTRSEVPLGKDLELAFLVERRSNGNVTVYRTPDETDANFMRCAVRIAPHPEGGTGFEIRLLLRLRREHATDVHWLAPLAGEDFVSARMNEDLRAMLAEFRDRSTAELQRTCAVSAQR
jgi:hypothetical protein